MNMFRILNLYHFVVFETTMILDTECSINDTTYTIYKSVHPTCILYSQTNQIRSFNLLILFLFTKELF